YARIADRHEFYGLLAAEEIGRGLSVPPRAAPPTPAELAAVRANPGFRRALAFYGVGLRYEGNLEWNFQLRGLSDRQLLAAAEFARRNQVYDRAVNTSARTVEEHDYSLRFLRPFENAIEAAAAEQDLDPAWIFGLIRQESRFVARVSSSAGARGLMQLMPATARWAARKMGLRGFRTSQLSDVRTNLDLGTWYLRRVYDQFDGSLLLAAAGYNAGPGRPRNWSRSLSEPIEGAVFAETIPFSETRDYVKQVLTNATIYAALMGGPRQPLKQLLGQVHPPGP
ncbi:MAG: transglycosylase SLT domain-containing protein, partial [Burkholderiales bacterium]